MWEKIKNTPLYLKAFYICIILSVGVWLSVLFPSEKYFQEKRFMNDSAPFFNEGWIDMQGNSIEVPGKYDVEAGESFRIQYVFPEDVGSYIGVMFYTDHTFVRAYQNEEEIYCFGKKEEIPFGKTPGSGWQLINLNKVSEGDILVLEMNCPYEKYSGLIRDIRVGTRAQLVAHVFKQGQVDFFLALIPLLIGLVIIFIPPFFFRSYPISFFFNVGISYVVVSIWSFTESRIWQLFFENAYAMQMLNFLTFLLFMPAVLVTVRMMRVIRNENLYRNMMLIDVGAALVIIMLQLFEVADFFEMLFVIHILMILNEIIFATAFIRQFKVNRGFQWLISILLYLGIGICIFLDLMNFYVWDIWGNGYFSRIQVLALLVATCLMTMKRTLMMQREIIEKKTYEKMAYTDNLTSLRNRRAFDRDIERIQAKPKEVTILYADMNGLKYINDHMGHDYGDEALKLVASHMVEIQNWTTLCYRLGGDEFCVLSYEDTPEMLEQKCREINHKLEIFEKKYGFPIGISYGAIQYVPGREHSIQQCMMEADAKMYQFKQTLYTERGIGR